MSASHAQSRARQGRCQRCVLSHTTPLAHPDCRLTLARPAYSRPSTPPSHLYTRPINLGLLRDVQRPHLYDHIRISTYSGLQALSTSGATTFRLLVRTKSLEIDVGDDDNLNWSFGQATPRVRVSEVQVQAFWRHFKQLRKVRIRALDPVILPALVTLAPDEYPKSLESVVLQGDSLYGPVDRTGGELLATLSVLPALSHLALSPSFGNTRTLPRQPAPPVTFVALTSLSLSLSPDDAATSLDLAVLAPALVELALVVDAPTTSCATILGTAPTRLRVLRLSTNGVERTYLDTPSSHIHALLPSFPHLVDLVLGAGTFDASALPTSLAQCTALSSLAFGYGALVTDRLLLEIVGDSQRPPLLTTLTVDTLQSRIGPRCESDDGPLPPFDYDDGDGDGERVCGGWEAPAPSPTGLSEEGVEAAVAVAAARGVEIRGSTLAALTWQQHHSAELVSRDALAQSWEKEYGERHEGSSANGDRPASDWEEDEEEGEEDEQ